MSLNPHPAKQLTIVEMHEVLLDVQRMLEQYQLQAGLRFGMMVIITSGPATCFCATLSPELVVPLMRSLADRVEREEPGDKQTQPTAH